MSVDKSLPVLHNAHVWAYFRHHPLDPDASLFVAFDEGSVRAYRELLALLIDNIQHRRRMPVGVREYGLRIVTTLIEGARKQHARWLERKSKRKGAVGRPQAPSRGEIKRQVLAALCADLAAQNRPDPAQHGAALRVLQDELEQLKNTPVKRRRRSQPPKHSHHADLAMDVWAQLQRAVKSGQPLSEAEAIRRVALARDALSNPGQPTRPRSSVGFDAREIRVNNLRKKIEAAYYALKADLSGKGVLGNGLIPLEKLLDD
ncbi:hypothetical protein [Castellaniella sp.]|uniref:hypothetical protein n=1 Tax=Castellaniella sp. TaxID=1955812 RepID=UPI002AFE4DA7|nr:hypothetical protein [Castellaniella sp.]